MRLRRCWLLVLLLGCRPETPKDGVATDSGPGDPTTSGETAETGETGETGETAETGEPLTGPALLQGYVRDTSGEPISGARVTVGDAETVTSDLGFFTLRDLEAGEVVIRAEASGYSTTSAVRTLRAETWTYVGLHVAPVEVLTWDPAVGGALETADGVRIELPEEGLVDAFGAPVTGLAQVAVTLLNSADTIAAAPGELMADDEGEIRDLKSLGMIEVRLTDEAGLPLQIAAPATISFPLADVIDAGDPAGYGLFGFDEETGRWYEAGEGRFAEGRFEAEVEHFSWWNCDAFTDTDQCVTGTLVTASQPLANQLVRVEASAGLGGGSASTDEDGRFVIGLPAGERVTLSLGYGSYTWESEAIQLSGETVPESERPEGCVDLGEIVVETTDDDLDGFPAQADGGPDCADDDEAVHPDAVDAPYSGVDEDCGGEDDHDQDQDGYVPDAYIGLGTTYVSGSGALPGGDCDDTDPWTSPGRVDYCNGLDDNCSGDEADASDQQTWYQDEDGDGYGTDESAERLCDAPGAGWVGEGGDCADVGADAAAYHPAADERCGDLEDYNCDGSVDDADVDGDGVLACLDCDDTNADAWPGAVEVCDGSDNDCDGETDADAVDRLSASPDFDADGYPDTSVVYTGCEVPLGYVEGSDGLEGDCDDADDARYPGAAEVCGDGVIQDCLGAEDAALDACARSGDVNIDDASAFVWRERTYDDSGSALALVGDVDGDGETDLLLGGDGGDRSLYLVRGPLGEDHWLGDDTDQIDTVDDDDGAGAALAAAGDLDGDGYADMLLGAPYMSGTYTYEGGAYVVLGPASDLDSLSEADALWTGEAASLRAGASVDGGGDLSGDGVPDLVVGAPHADTDRGDGVGVAYVLYGPATTSGGLDDADVTLEGARDEERAAADLTIAGDLDGDGLQELVIGATYTSLPGERGTGGIYLLYGPVSGHMNLEDADEHLVDETAYSGAGTAVDGAGDTNGDGLDDVLVGAYLGGPSGVAYLLCGPARGLGTLSDADAVLSGTRWYAGISVAGAGDTDADGFDDLFIGDTNREVSDETGSSMWTLGAYLALGPLSGASSLEDAAVQFTYDRTGDQYGGPVDGGADLDGDGRDDLVMGDGELPDGPVDEYLPSVYIFLASPY